MTARNRVTFVTAAAALLVIVALVAPGCSGKKKAKGPESLFDKLPTKDAVLKIDGHEISGAWLRNWCVSQYIMLMRSSRGVPLKIDEYSLIQGGMDLLGKLYVIGLEAEKRGITVSDAEIQEQMGKESSRFESSAEWQKTMEKSGVTIDERRRELRVELLNNKYRDQIVAPLVREKFANDTVARQYYDGHTDVFKEPRRVHLLHITRSVAKDATEEVKKRERDAIEKARLRVAGGEKFEDVAREVSTEATAMKGGEVGWLTEDAPIQPALKPALMGLKAGEMTAVLETPQGYHLFKAVEVKEPGVRKFEDAKDEIKKRLFEQAVKLELEKTAGQLRSQLIAEKKYEVLDLKAILGDPPKPNAEAPKPAPAK